VVGDLLVFNTGNQIGADIRLVTSNRLQIDESSLTGESVAINKNADGVIAEGAPLGDRLNMAFSGTNVLNGNGVGIVVAVGMESRIGQIARLLKGQTKEKTQLHKRIDVLAKKLAVLAFLAGANIKKTIYYLLTANVAEIIIMLFAAIIGWGMPLTGIQLLFINILAGGIPGFGLSREKAEQGVINIHLSE